ncbi:Mucin-21 [Xylographa trunciseda]|nr:Mucin-21 [Xylographa trunciseda]
MQYSVLLGALYASVALAIVVTSPDDTTTWSDSGKNTIKWTSVNTDPSTVNIVLINNAVYPNTAMNIASNIQTSSGSYTVDSLTGTGGGFQINLMSTTNDQILAQSKNFTLSNTSPASGGGSSVSSASMTSSTSTSAAASSTSTASPSTSSTTLTSMSTSGMSTASTASTASTGSTASTASTGSTMSTATASGTPTGSAGAGSTSGTASSTATISTSSSGATMKAISFVGLGLGGLLAFLA